MNTSLLISIGFMGLCCVVAAFARIFVARAVKSAFVKELLYEAIAAAELCACCFELIIGKSNAFIKPNNPNFFKLLHRLSLSVSVSHCSALCFGVWSMGFSSSFIYFCAKRRLRRFSLCYQWNSHTVADNFGVSVYAICLFFLTILWSMVWNDATACPYTHMEDLLQGKTSLRSVVLKTWAQLMGGCCVYRVVQIFWWFEFAQTHEGRAFESCTTDLQVR